MIQKPRLQTIAYLGWQNKNISLKTFKSLKEKKDWGVQVEDPHVDLFTIQKNKLFLFYRQILFFYLKKTSHFLKKAATFCKEMGGVPLKVNTFFD